MLSRVGTVILAGLLLASCNYHREKAGPTTPVKGPEPKPGEPPIPTDSFRAVNAIMKAKCLGCHGDASKNGDFSTHAKLLDSGHVAAGKPEDSAFYTDVIPDPANPKDPPYMPFKRPGQALTTAEAKTFFDWIKQGAKND